MTETRKQIIELISDYMDKTLSDGCWLLYKPDDCYHLYSISSHIHQEGIEAGDVNILGHYDITAVLKYIGKRVYHINLDINQEYFEVSITSDDLVEQQFYSLPNKPLHLYAPQEDKDLLDLLLNLS